MVEAGEGQSGDIEALMTAAGLTTAGPPKADLAGIRRAVAGRKIAPIKSYWNAKKPLGITPGNDYVPPIASVGLLAP